MGCRQKQTSHVPVLKQEVLNLLDIRPDGIYLDGTAGLGGHASAIQSQLSEKGILIGLDVDEEAVKLSRTVLSASSTCHLFNDSFDNSPRYLESLGIEKVDGILIDLGLSSHQLESPHRGFSYRIEGPLDMRFNLASSLTAEEIVNRWDEHRLKEIIWKFGEERQAARISRAIVKRRKARPLSTTFDLRDAVLSVAAKRYATKSLSRVFQAFRIAVNGELNSLKAFLNTFMEYLAVGGRIVLIAYHSLEDRLVKNTFRELAKGPPSRLRILTPRPVTPGEDEIRRNRRARSAKLRAGERIE